MKRKQLTAVGILSICLFASGCGSNTASTEQGTENTVIVQETEMQETETQEAETQEVEIQENESTDTEILIETEIEMTEEEKIEDAWKMLGEFSTCYGIDLNSLTVNEATDKVEETFGRYWDEEEKQYVLEDGTFIEYNQKYISTSAVAFGTHVGIHKLV